MDWGVVFALISFVIVIFESLEKASTSESKEQLISLIISWNSPKKTTDFSKLISQSIFNFFKKKAFLKSTIFSLIMLGIGVIYISSKSAEIKGMFQEAHVFLVLGFLIILIIPDYISLKQSLFFLKKIESSNKIIQIIIFLLIDLILTFLISSTNLFLIFGVSSQYYIAFLLFFPYSIWIIKLMNSTFSSSGQTLLLKVFIVFSYIIHLSLGFIISAMFAYENFEFNIASYLFLYNFYILGNLVFLVNLFIKKSVLKTRLKLFLFYIFFLSQYYFLIYKLQVVYEFPEKIEKGVYNLFILGIIFLVLFLIYSAINYLLNKIKHKLVKIIFKFIHTIFIFLLMIGFWFSSKIEVWELIIYSKPLFKFLFVFLFICFVLIDTKYLLKNHFANNFNSPNILKIAFIKIVRMPRSFFIIIIMFFVFSVANIYFFQSSFFDNIFSELIGSINLGKFMENDEGPLLFVLLFFSTFFTSFWIYLYFISLGLMKLLVLFRKGSSKILGIIDLKAKPYTSLGIISGIFILITCGVIDLLT